MIRRVSMGQIVDKIVDIVANCERLTNSGQRERFDDMPGRVADRIQGEHAPGRDVKDQRCHICRNLP